MAPPPPRRTGVAKRRMRSKDAAERSAYFARREAAAVLRRVLRGDARRRATASIKSLVYSPSVRNKKATLALVCQTLKYLPLLKDALRESDILSNKWKKQEELIYDIAISGSVEKFLMLHKGSLQSSLAQLCTARKVKCVADLLLDKHSPDLGKPRYVRINTLKIDTESVIQEFGKITMVRKDDMVPDMLVLPAGIDLHDHPLVVNGSVFLQGKASSMVALALSPEPGWKVLDACAAPGNKTVHLAALMKGKGNVIACELHEHRVKTLDNTIRRSGAPNVDIIRGDFLDINPGDPLFAKVHAILLDPSCSGSGISVERLDHLLPSHSAGNGIDIANSRRINKLAAFQRKALEHALSFPLVERVVYSTCSIHQEENEDVVKSVLPLAASLGFELASPFPQWHHRGLPLFEGSEHLLRTDPADNLEGFFIALFVRKHLPDGNFHPEQCKQRCPSSENKHHRKRKRKRLMPLTVLRMSRRLLFHSALLTPSRI
ncbi:putative 28S rRNA (cytosine-C(5))-methyltransferase [Ananas comosus]|uniref:Putative 28S rRNA (Cytosine-C(5))-methyltransferase n=1 Tax=Ananas comosus TaxID=4615 RepID=A0A199VRU0_ANACO|nr:putative 28S rRNA (cytosine-C(5))-methyltransferase [Ananas comosus]